MTRTEARAEVNSRPELALNELTKSKAGAYICPCCNSGTGKNHTGALTYYPDKKRFTCHACSEREGFGRPGQDVLGALRLIWDCTETEVFERIGITLDRSSRTQRTTKSTQDSAQEPKKYNTPTSQEYDTPKDYTKYYAECKKQLQNSEEAISYLQARGISKETAAAYWIGFDINSDPAQSNHPTPRIILPTCKTHYVARSIDPKTPPQWVKMNNKGGSPDIFNKRALDGKEAVFVCEGIFDALSIIEAGAEAIALNSTSNAGRLIEQLQKKRTAATLILCLDNDEAGKKCTETITEGLKRLNISYVIADICQGCKDPNEALQKDRNGFIKAVNEAIRTTAARPDNITDYIDSVMQGEI